MTNHHEGGDNLLRDVLRFKRLWHAARDENARQAALIAEQRLELIASRVRTSGTFLVSGGRSPRCAGQGLFSLPVFV